MTWGSHDPLRRALLLPAVAYMVGCGGLRRSVCTTGRSCLFVFLGKSAFVFYWAEGRYWLFWTAD